MHSVNLLESDLVRHLLAHRRIDCWCIDFGKRLLEHASSFAVVVVVVLAALMVDVGN